MPLTNTQEHIDKCIRESRGEPHKKSGKFSPSSFGYCLRRQFWGRKDEPQTNPPDEQAFRVFKCGDLFEEFIASYIEGERQVKCEDDQVKGFADIVRDDEVIEIKSKHSFFFNHLKKSVNGGETIYDIIKHHFLQNGYYAWKLGKEFVHIILITKDTLLINDYIKPTADIVPDLEKEINDLMMHWDNNLLPPAKPRLFSGKECSYCPYKDKCDEWEKRNRVKDEE